jgi:hypothetical protein
MVVIHIHAKQVVSNAQLKHKFLPMLQTKKHIQIHANDKLHAYSTIIQLENLQANSIHNFCKQTGALCNFSYIPLVNTKKQVSQSDMPK